MCISGEKRPPPFLRLGKQKAAATKTGVTQRGHDLSCPYNHEEWAGQPFLRQDKL
jgi:hypothetical protein